MLLELDPEERDEIFRLPEVQLPPYCPLSLPEVQLLGPTRLLPPYCPLSLPEVQLLPHASRLQPYVSRLQPYLCRCASSG